MQIGQCELVNGLWIPNNIIFCFSNALQLKKRKQRHLTSIICKPTLFSLFFLWGVKIFIVWLNPPKKRKESRLTGYTCLPTLVSLFHLNRYSPPFGGVKSLVPL